MGQLGHEGQPGHRTTVPRPRLLRSWTVLVVLAFAARAGRAGDETSPWRDAKVLEVRFAEACDAVEKATGAAFAKRPTVRLSTREEVGKILRGELGPLFEAMGTEKILDQTLRLFGAALVAKYEPATHVIHVVPDVVDDMAEVETSYATEDVLRVVLVHEATHAHDFPRYGWEAMRVARTTEDGQKALGAVIEGHAQYVAEQVAKDWGLTPAFEAFTRAITALPPIENEAMRQVAKALAAEMGFGYVQGHAFLKAVHAARGAEGLEKVLKEPPAGTRVVEHPELWLDPKADSGIDLAALLEGARWLVAGPQWVVRADRVLEGTLRSQLGELAKEKQDKAFAGYEDGRMLVGVLPGDGAQLIVMALRYATPEGAKGFHEVEEESVRAKDATMKEGPIHVVSSTYEKGAGPEGKLPGVFVERVVKAMGEDHRVFLEIAVLDRVVIEAMSIGVPGVTRATLDEAVARLAAWADDPSKPYPPHEPLIVPKSPGTLTIHVLDGDGKPVPRAKARFVLRESASRSTQWTEVEDGEAVFRHVKGMGSLDVWGASADDDAPLPWGPAHVEFLPSELGNFEVRLPAERTLAGRVLGEEGRGLAGVRVAALPEGETPDPAELVVRVRQRAHGVATTDSEGRFVLHGLGEGNYSLVLTETGEHVAPADLLAKAGESDLTLSLRKGVSPTLTVLGPDGVPVASARAVVMRVQSRPGGFTSHSIAEAESDASGVIRLPRLDPAGAYELDVKVAGTSAGYVPEHRREWVPHDETFHLRRAFTIRGVVHDPGGNPVQAHVWFREKRSIWDMQQVRTGADGRFEIPDVPPGIRLATTTTNSFEPGKYRWVTVTPDDADVVLVLGAKPPRLTVLGGKAGDSVRLMREGDAEPGGFAGRGLDGDRGISLAWWHDEPAATYTLWIGPAGEGGDQFLYVTGFRIPEKDTTVTLVPSLPIRVKLRGAEGAARVDVAVLGPADVVFTPLRREDGTYAVYGLPEGKWKVKAKARGESAWLNGTADASPGDTVEITLVPK